MQSTQPIIAIESEIVYICTYTPLILLYIFTGIAKNEGTIAKVIAIDNYKDLDKQFLRFNEFY